MTGLRNEDQRFRLTILNATLETMRHPLIYRWVLTAHNCFFAFNSQSLAGEDHSILLHGYLLFKMTMRMMIRTMLLMTMLIMTMLMRTMLLMTMLKMTVTLAFRRLTLNFRSATTPMEVAVESLVHYRSPPGYPRLKILLPDSDESRERDEDLAAKLGHIRRCGKRSRQILIQGKARPASILLRPALIGVTLGLG